MIHILQGCDIYARKKKTAANSYNPIYYTATSDVTDGDIILVFTVIAVQKIGLWKQ